MHSRIPNGAYAFHIVKRLEPDIVVDIQISQGIHRYHRVDRYIGSILFNIEMNIISDLGSVTYDTFKGILKSRGLCIQDTVEL